MTKLMLFPFSLTFVFTPSSRVYGIESIELKEGGADIDVTADNMQVYVDLVTHLFLQAGIKKQMQALKSEYFFTSICALLVVVKL